MLDERLVACLAPPGPPRLSPPERQTGHANGGPTGPLRPHYPSRSGPVGPPFVGPVRHRRAGPATQCHSAPGPPQLAPSVGQTGHANGGPAGPLRPHLPSRSGPVGPPFVGPVRHRPQAGWASKLSRLLPPRHRHSATSRPVRRRKASASRSPFNLKSRTQRRSCLRKSASSFSGWKRRRMTG